MIFAAKCYRDLLHERRILSAQENLRQMRMFVVNVCSVRYDLLQE